MSIQFRLSGKVNHVGRRLGLDLGADPVFAVSVGLDETKSDEAAVTPLIGSYPGALEVLDLSIGNALHLSLQAPYLSKISKRIDEPYAYILEAQVVGEFGDGTAMRGILEIILTGRADAAPANDDDALGPPIIDHYRDRRWRIWLAMVGHKTDKIEGQLVV